MLLENTQTGEKFSFTFESVGACNPETLAFAISEIQKHNLPVTRIVSIVGLDELMEKGWIRPMLQMAQDADIRLIVPPVSPLMEVYDGKLEMRWNATTPEGAWLGTAWNDDTIQKCVEVLDEFMDDYSDDFPLDDCFGVLVTDTGLLHELPADVFAKVSVLCGTSNSSKAHFLSESGAGSINLVPMYPRQVKEIFECLKTKSRHPFFCDLALLDVYIDPPRSICPPWYTLDDVLALAPQYVEAGAYVLKAEGTEIVAQLLDHDYLVKIAIPRQTAVFLEVMDTLNTPPYRMVSE